METGYQLYHVYVRSMFVSNIQSILKMYKCIYPYYNHYLIHLYEGNKEAIVIKRNYSRCVTLVPDNTINYNTCEWKDHGIVQNRIIQW
jgi:hypothetical protein